MLAEALARLRERAALATDTVPGGNGGNGGKIKQQQELSCPHSASGMWEQREHGGITGQPAPPVFPLFPPDAEDVGTEKGQEFQGCSRRSHRSHAVEDGPTCDPTRCRRCGAS